MRSLLFLFLSVALAAAVRFDGHQIVGLKPTNLESALRLRDFVLELDGKTLDFHTNRVAVGYETRVRVPPEHRWLLEDAMQEAGIPIRVIHPDFQEIVDRDQAEMNPDVFDLRQFNSYDWIVNWLNGEASQACGSRCSVSDLGTSFEGRNIRMIKITGDGSARNSIFVDSGIHAREWIAVSSMLWIINAFINEYSTNQRIQDVVNRFDWYFVPVLNPDGYEWTRNETDGDRAWRKTRSGCPDEFTCCGVDGNRNFGYMWGMGGSSSDNCSDTFMGPRPWSEPETAAVRDFVTSIRGNTTAYISVHTHGNWWLTPYGYSYDREPQEMMNVGQITIDAIHAWRDANPDIDNDQEYRLGSIANLLYIASGNSVDWAHEGFGEPNMAYTYTPELPGFGDAFYPPAEKIPQAGGETLAGYIAMAEAFQT